MTPAPIELPLRPSEAASLATLVYEQVDGRKLTDDLRARLAGRSSTLGLRTVAPHFGSLEADPIHPAAYYLAVDGLAGAEPVPLLLHMAPAASPAAGLFPKPLLIGRMRPVAGREIVLNAIAFAPADTQAVSTFATAITTAFLPRAHGAVPLIWVDTGGDPAAACEALNAFRSLQRATGLNVAGLRLSSAALEFWPLVWAAVRAGYREGYSLAGPYTGESAKLLSCFRVRPQEAVEAFHVLRSVRSGIPFDIEVDLRQCDSADALDSLRRAGVAPQFVLAPPETGTHGAVASIDIPPGSLEAAGRARASVQGPCAVTVAWRDRRPPIGSLLEALR